MRFEDKWSMRTVPADLVTRYEAEGWWTPDTIGTMLTKGLATAAAVFWASAFLGAVVVPVVHFYGRKEVGYILDAVRPRVFVTAERFGRMEYQPDLCDGVPVVAVVDRDFDKLLAAEPMSGTLAVDPAGPALIAFTSGTTRDPKGVVHSHQTLGFETGQLVGLYPPDRGHQLTSAPVGHFIGMINAFLIPVIEGTPVNLADAWDPAVVLGLIRTDRLTVGGGAPYYLTTLLDHPDFAPDVHLRQRPVDHGSRARRVVAPGRGLGGPADGCPRRAGQPPVRPVPHG
jgi:acyl-CoA synthetase